jgi:arsenite-transporting ATPase
VAHTSAQQQTRSQPVEQWLRSLQQKLLLVAGKGGVGKSTCAAAIAGAVAKERRVCVVSTDPAGSLSDIFGVTVSSTVVEIDPNLYAQQVDAALEFQRMRETYRDRVGEVLAEMGLDASLRLDRNVIESLWDFAPPGIDELIALLDILERADEFDVLVIDAAPTGHFLRLIALPEIARGWVHSLLRLLLKYSSLGSLDALARDLLGFAKNLRQLQLDLSTPGRAAVFVVTLDQPVVAAETSRLASAIERAQLPVAATILNRAGSATNSMGEQADFARMQTILAPNVDAEIIGPVALRAFVEQWEFSRE